MSRLFVWMRLTDGTVRLAGELTTSDPIASGRRMEGRRSCGDNLSAVRAFPTIAKSLAVRGAESLENISADVRRRLKTIVE
jgi:hypothetical protein